MSVKVEVKLDQAAIDRELHSRNGAVGRVLAGFAGLATREIKQVMVQRAGGSWWPVTSSITGGTDPRLEIAIKATRAHVIVPRNTKVLVFQGDRGTVFTRHVNHPGSSVPVKLVQQGVENAGRKFPSIAGGS